MLEPTSIESKPITEAESLSTRFQRVRQFTEQLCQTLEPEDCVVQSMPDASPIRWHLAHTTWFFETFLLVPFEPQYSPKHSEYAVLFNSYYNTIGQQFPRSQRGLLSRPTVAEVWNYRQRIDALVISLLDRLSGDPELDAVVELGLQHEQQHQELMLTDIKHLFSCNPLFPAFQSRADHVVATGDTLDMKWYSQTEQLAWLGHDGHGFCFDNELPRHQHFVPSFQLAHRLVTNREYLRFIQDGGYQRPELWLSMGWHNVQDQRWKHPLYWHRQADDWLEFTLSGLLPIDWDQPVCHVSYFEADAFARWAGCRLPTEFEWELAAKKQSTSGNFAESMRFQPIADTGPSNGIHQMFGDTWEWTASAYAAYPGYQPAAGALGEYNGKFMCNQFVLRGGSCATSASHIRKTYRNFFPPDARWQFSGIRLAQ